MDSNQTIENRLKRAEGQIRAVLKMVQDNRAPKDVLIQLNAALSSLEMTKIAFVEESTKAKIMASINELSELLK